MQPTSSTENRDLEEVYESFGEKCARMEDHVDRLFGTKGVEVACKNNENAKPSGRKKTAIILG